MSNINFAEYGLTNAVEVIRTVQVTGKARAGGYATAEITVAKLVFDTEGRKAGPIVVAMRVLLTPANSAPMLGQDFGSRWQWKMSGYNQNEEIALQTAMINFEIWYLDTPRAREAEEARNQQQPS